jgi:hypothetical protein
VIQITSSGVDMKGEPGRGLPKPCMKLALRPASSLPPGPGLGVEVNEKRIEELAARPQTYRWPGSKLPDGSVADY